MLENTFYLVFIVLCCSLAFLSHYLKESKYLIYSYTFSVIFFFTVSLCIFFYFDYYRLNSKNLFIVENEHHQIKFKTDGHCVVRETCCHSEKYCYAYGKYELTENTILLDGKVFNRKNFKTFTIKDKKVRLVSKDEKRNDYYTFEIVEDNRITTP